MIELSVVVPTYNEAGNIRAILDRLEEALKGIPHEILVADDDSPDRTWEIAAALAADRPGLRCLRRTRDRGLYPAVVEAFRAASGTYLAVLDADLQHDERVLPAMLKAARERGWRVVVGSRYAAGGGIERWGGARRAVSLGCTWLARAALGTPIRDPLSGFFLLERDVFLAAAPALKPRGFKILMDLLRRMPPGTSAGEVGYVFRPRLHGRSKLGAKVAWDFLRSLAGAALGRLAR